MNLNEIKIGAKLACDAKIAEIDGDVVYIEFSAHKKFRLAAELVELLDAQNADPAPKYDPCRRLRRGDKVRVVERDGRDYIDYDPYTNIQKSELYTVLENENEVIDGGCVDIRIGKGDIEYAIPFYFLELITPVEELETYSLFDNKRLAVWTVLKNELIFAYYPYRINESDNVVHSKKEALAAAEAECARLNAEYRKEQE